ncbi:hypothetical protein M758_1G312600 [Ceratodon purpureus]|uniref:Uncharacterized protein n=1 Tax=Ceratodon purpureus TaxID=3225 RepID=A0A8T0JF52_CERPU|nr:hypothetical protein KC19_1G319500 [Ceratodon purpureus]KAG0632219.1 hypothetical protein M758_1G312600 [Ceratodon purpureus]
MQPKPTKAETTQWRHGVFSKEEVNIQKSVNTDIIPPANSRNLTTAVAAGRAKEPRLYPNGYAALETATARSVLHLHLVPKYIGTATAAPRVINCGARKIRMPGNCSIHRPEFAREKNHTPWATLRNPITTAARMPPMRARSRTVGESNSTLRSSCKSRSVICASSGCTLLGPVGALLVNGATNVTVTPAPSANAHDEKTLPSVSSVSAIKAMEIAAARKLLRMPYSHGVGDGLNIKITRMAPTSEHGVAK